VPAVQHLNLGKPDSPSGPAEENLPVSALDLNARATYDGTPHAGSTFVTLPAEV